jgi:DNA-binding protein Fis
MQSIVRQASDELHGASDSAFVSAARGKHRNKTQGSGTTLDGEMNTGVPSDLAAFVNRRLEAESRDLYAETLEQMERYLITRVLQATDGNQTKASEILGITRGKIRDRVNLFQISLDTTVSVEE